MASESALWPARASAAALLVIVGAGTAWAQAVHPPVAGTGYSSADSPGHAVVHLEGRRVGDLANLGRMVDPTGKLDARQYHHFLLGVAHLRGGTAMGSLGPEERSAIARLRVDDKSLKTDVILPFRDDPVYALDRTRRIGRPKNVGGRRCAEVPVYEISVIRYPLRIKQHRYLCAPCPHLVELESFILRSLVPTRLRRVDGSIGAPLELLALDGLTALPPRRTRSVVLPVGTDGLPELIPVNPKGATLDGRKLARRNFSGLDDIVGYDNAGRERIRPEDLDSASVFAGTLEP